MKKASKMLMPVIAVLMISALALSAAASWSSDVSGGSSVTIGSDEPFTAASFLGVDALYSLTVEDYTSDELVVRFYSEAYGITITAGASGPAISTAGYVFKTPATPTQGDIIYSSSSGCWAIVKSYTRGKITMFEQNVVSDGKATVNRTLKYPSDSYALYTPRPKTGYQYLVLKNADSGATVLTANGRTSNTTAVSTTATTKATTTAKGSTTVKGSTAKTTTKKDQQSTYKDKTVEYTTYKGNETVATTAKPTYTTQPMPEGYEQFYTSTVSGEETASTDNSIIYTTMNLDDGQTTVYTTKSMEKEKEPVNPTLIFGIAVVAGIVFITAAGILAGVAIKHRGHNDDDDD